MRRIDKDIIDNYIYYNIDGLDFSMKDILKYINKFNFGKNWFWEWYL